MMERIIESIEGDQGEAGGTDPQMEIRCPAGLSPSMIPPALRYIHTEFQYNLPADFECLNIPVLTLRTGWVGFVWSIWVKVTGQYCEPL